MQWHLQSSAMKKKKTMSKRSEVWSLTHDLTLQCPEKGVSTGTAV